MAEERQQLGQSAAGAERHSRLQESGTSQAVRKSDYPGSPMELHVCMGLNTCAGHDRDGKAKMAGMGECATLQHSCHGTNNCRGQGGCGYAGDEVAQMKPGDQSCRQNGSCASPINISRVSSAGPNKGKSVWKLARQIFETRMDESGNPFGPSPGEGYPDDLVPDYLDD